MQILSGSVCRGEPGSNDTQQQSARPLPGPRPRSQHERASREQGWNNLSNKIKSMGLKFRV